MADWSVGTVFWDPPEKIVHSWDVVEYESPDGLIHRGIVADIIEHGMRKGLLVDQLSGGNSPSQILVPFQNALRFETHTYLISRHPKHADIVHILLQTSPDVPWTWFPGKLLLTDRRSFALVKVHRAENELCEIVVPAAHVRFDHPKEFVKRIGRNDFVKKVVQVPEEFLLDDDVRKRWEERFPGTKPCTLFSSSLTYLQAVPKRNTPYYQYHGIGADARHFAQSLPKAKEKELTMITASMIYELMHEIRPATKEPVSHSMRPYDGPCIHDILAEEIMAKIFRFLFTEHQAKARRVCKQWNFWLQSPAYSKEVRFDLCGENRYTNENNCLRKFFAYVHDILSPTCKSVVLTAGNGNVVRHLLSWETSMFPKWDTNHPKWSTTYTLTRAGVRWSFELVIIRIYSYHGPNENALEPTVFPDESHSKPGLPTALTPYVLLGGEVEPVSCACLSNPTRSVFTAGHFGGQYVLTWDFLGKGQSDKPTPSYRTRCFEKDSIAQLKLSADGRSLFAHGNQEIAVMDVCQDVLRVKTSLRSPGVPSHHGDYYARERSQMAVSAEGNLCFVSCIMGYILVWDVRSGKVAARIREQPYTRTSQTIDLSSDGLALWTAGRDMKVRTLDIRTLTLLRELPMTGLSLHGISCCPDNKWIAVGTKKKFSYVDTFEKSIPGGPFIRQSSVVVEIINITKPEEYRLDILDEDEPGWIKYSPDGAWLLATTDMELTLFHHPYGRLAFREHMAGSLDGYHYGGCDISADGKFVAKGVLDGAVMVYEVIY